MSVTITIQGTPIEFPSSGESPNWAPAVVEFAQATETAILSAVGEFDVPPTVVDITAAQIASNVFNSVVELNFTDESVRSVQINYAISLAGTIATEAGTMTLLYDNNKGINEKWILSREYIGETGCEFQVLDDGQVQIKVPSSSGYTSGKLSFSAKALEQI